MLGCCEISITASHIPRKWYARTVQKALHIVQGLARSKFNLVTPFQEIRRADAAGACSHIQRGGLFKGAVKRENLQTAKQF